MAVPSASNKAPSIAALLSPRLAAAAAVDGDIGQITKVSALRVILAVLVSARIKMRAGAGERRFALANGMKVQTVNRSGGATGCQANQSLTALADKYCRASSAPICGS